MKYYSQKNPRWRWQKLGTCKQNIGQVGCFVTSLANLADTEIVDPRGIKREANPSIVDWVATVKKLYTGGCLVVSKKFAKLLKLEYHGKAYKRPSYPCIMETNYYRKYGVPQHFCVIFPDGDIIDPLDLFPKKKANKYAHHIVSYRLFKNPNYQDCESIKIKIKLLEKKLKRLKKELKICNA